MNDFSNTVLYRLRNATWRDAPLGQPFVERFKTSLKDSCNKNQRLRGSRAINGTESKKRCYSAGIFWLGSSVFARSQLRKRKSEAKIDEVFEMTDTKIDRSTYVIPRGLTIIQTGLDPVGVVESLIATLQFNPPSEDPIPSLDDNHA
ncbi:Protein of unknown function [Pyronema omphalodes CBS 100304]|uniref:Uncharacterized protein n=1 Tax=Pyronema omphalodes (strain CBS 100304) TaxID=1076935 RepID=U4L6C2_PYROM|nr:Protein of unknown function [Pyronema omphalodes CBS 100304]